MAKTSKATKPALKPSNAVRNALKKVLPSEPDDVAKVASQNGLEKEYKTWCKKGNHGTARMSLGNVLAGRLRRGEKVKVAGRVIDV